MIMNQLRLVEEKKKNNNNRYEESFCVYVCVWNIDKGILLNWDEMNWINKQYFEKDEIYI